MVAEHVKQTSTQLGQARDETSVTMSASEKVSKD